ncbi:hypothetical protein HAHE_21860 [Haloferula helveola]|uniref:Uncharacterized protein n=1 Tax=Haloferula helveola TaxID=490095 RepID=A0ABN6H8N2_9BACT|nr:hypothetical protein HAHE_21860 [Haloferula helveola]
MNATSTSTIVVPRTKTRPGLIASAKTFRLVCDDQGLHVIHLGRAMGPKVKSRDPIADKLAGVMISKMERKLEESLAEAEREIEYLPLAELVARKHSFTVPLTERGAVEVRSCAGADLVLVIRAPQKKAKLLVHSHYRDELEAIERRFGG